MPTHQKQDTTETATSRDALLEAEQTLLLRREVWGNPETDSEKTQEPLGC